MIRHLLAVAAIVALTAPWCPLSGLASEPASIVAGHIVNVAGKVRIRKDGSKDSKDVRFAKAGEVVMVGDIINTPSDGQIKLLLKDRSIMDLGPSSLFKVNAFNSNGTNERQVDATIVYGNLRTAVTQRLEGRGSFKVRSPSATMGVRGTEFVVNSVVNDLRTAQDALQGRSSGAAAGTTDAAQARITVLSGLVAVAPPLGTDPASAGGASSSGSSTLLAAGTQLTASMGDALTHVPPQRLDAATLQMTASASRSVDNTFQASLEIKADKKSEMAEQRSQANENNSQQANKQDQKNETKAESKQEVADGSGQAAGTAEPSKDVSPDSTPESVSSSGGEATAAAPPQTAASESTNRAPASDSAASAPPPPAPISSGAVSFTGALANGLTASLNSAVTQSITTVNVVPAGTITTTQIVAPPPVFDPTAMYPIQIRVNLGATAAP